MIELNTNIFYIVIPIAIVFIYFLFFRTPKQLYKLAPLLTNNEKDCFNHLRKLFPEYYIAPQVSMGALLIPNVEKSKSNTYDNSYYHSLRGKINSNRIDFVMLDNNLNPVFIVELDDNSHNDKQDLDKQRDLHFMKAGLKTVRFRRLNGKFPPRTYFDKILNS